MAIAAFNIKRRFLDPLYLATRVSRYPVIVYLGGGVFSKHGRPGGI
jgi:hypothetical protein